MNAVEAVIGLALLIAAGSWAIPGWLLNEPNQGRRYACRTFAWLALLGVFGLQFSVDFAKHDWPWAANSAFLVAIAMWRVRCWWQAVERIREFRRIMAEKPTWLR